MVLNYFTKYISFRNKSGNNKGMYSTITNCLFCLMTLSYDQFLNWVDWDTFTYNDLKLWNLILDFAWIIESLVMSLYTVKINIFWTMASFLEIDAMQKFNIFLFLWYILQKYNITEPGITQNKFMQFPK